MLSKARCISEVLNVLDSISLALVECEYDEHICMYTPIAIIQGRPA